MESVPSIKNQYRGINAHLHSYLQSEGGWGGFHTLQRSDLFKALNQQLFPMGYLAGIEESLQIRRVDAPPQRPEADGLVYDLDPQRFSTPSAGQFSATQTIALPELLDERELSEKPYRAISIHELDSKPMRPGQPVAWIELLSPSNKGGSEDAEAYRAKRMNLMVQGLVFVELDYLHETPPTFATIPLYRPQKGLPPHPKASAYRILVIDPRPKLLKGQASIERFGVDDALPSVEIPLSGRDVLTFNFGEPYQRTFNESGYGRRFVDYTQLPLNFERYSEADQARIVARMLAVLKAAQAGVNLDALDEPLPVEPIALEDGLAQLRGMTAAR